MCVLVSAQVSAVPEPPVTGGAGVRFPLATRVDPHVPAEVGLQGEAVTTQGTQERPVHTTCTEKTRVEYYY